MIDKDEYEKIILEDHVTLKVLRERLEDVDRIIPSRDTRSALVFVGVLLGHNQRLREDFYRVV